MPRGGLFQRGQRRRGYLRLGGALQSVRCDGARLARSSGALGCCENPTGLGARVRASFKPPQRTRDVAGRIFRQSGGPLHGTDGVTAPRFSTAQLINRGQGLSLIGQWLLPGLRSLCGQGQRRDHTVDQVSGLPGLVVEANASAGVIISGQQSGGMLVEIRLQGVLHV
jgi:hypothetical protein